MQIFEFIDVLRQVGKDIVVLTGITLSVRRVRWVLVVGRGSRFRGLGLGWFGGLGGLGGTGLVLLDAFAVAFLLLWRAVWTGGECQ